MHFGKPLSKAKFKTNRFITLAQKQKNPHLSGFCDSPRTRTWNLLLRRQLLYPVELANQLAERGGFEPPVRFLARMFSKHVVSATHPPLRGYF